MMGSAVIEKIRIDGSGPTEVIPGVRAVRLFFAGDQLIFAGVWMGEFPLYEATADAGSIGRRIKYAAPSGCFLHFPSHRL